MRTAYPIFSSLAALLTATALSSGAVAQATTRCADIQDNAERLACYDRAARGGPTPTTRTAPPPAPTGPRTASPTPTTRARRT